MINPGESFLIFATSSTIGNCLSRCLRKFVNSICGIVSYTLSWFVVVRKEHKLLLAKSLTFALTILATVFASAAVSHAADLFEWLNPDLALAKKQLLDTNERLQRMGPITLGKTSQEAGLQHLMTKDLPIQTPFIQLDLGTSVAFDSVVIVPAILSYESIDRPAYAFPIGFRVDVSDEPEFGKFSNLYDSGDQTIETISGLPLIIKSDGGSARFIRVTVNKMPVVSGYWTYALSEIMVLQGNYNLAIRGNIQSPGTTDLKPIWHDSFAIDGRTPLGPPIETQITEFDGLFSRPNDPSSDNWMMLDLGEVFAIDEIRLHPVHARQGADFPGYAFPIRFRIEVSLDAEFQNPTVVFDCNDQPFSNPGNNPVTLPVNQVQGRFVRLWMIESAKRETGILGLSEFEVYANHHNVAKGKDASVAADARGRPTSLLVDGFTSYGKIIEIPEWIQRLDQRRLDLIKRSELQNSVKREEHVSRTKLARWSSIGVVSMLLLGTSLILYRNYVRKRELLAFRMRIAQDLHDEIGSNLAAISRLSEVALLETPDGSGQSDWLKVQHMSRECSNAMRETLWMLGSRQSSDGDFGITLRDAGSRILGDIELKWKQVGEWPSSRDFEVLNREVYLCFKEIMTNVIKHSKASHVDCNITVEPKKIELIVRDNGVGVPDLSSTKGLGLNSIRKRVQKLGGTVQWASQNSQGLRISLTFPIHRRTKRGES